MPLVSTGDILTRRRVVPAFNVIQIEHAHAIVAGAESASSPVALQISENAAKYHGALAPIALAARRIAEDAGVDVALHLDHAESEDLVREAIDLGFTSAMFDASRSPYDENVARTARMAAEARAQGVWIEAELGEIGGKDGAHAPGVRTDPDEARSFVADTGVDALAVAVGSSHAMTTRTASLDIELIDRLAEAVPVPLVLHGSSGVADAEIRRGIDAGMRKVNVSTHLNGILTRRVREALVADEALVDPRKYLGPGRDAMAAEVARLCEVIS
ncbi:class II fructose-bisphosphate aldolase [Microbacterium sp. gxy059]|uniref:class II fructose-bisphosphate aldolase n=1 Tax=Microbacterium sp. gxy059 TaxID=2957199 RepID=UPI003D96EEB5